MAKKMVGVIFSNGKRNLCVDSLSFVDALPEVVYYVMSQTAECQVGRFWSHANATFLALFAVGSYHFDRPSHSINCVLDACNQTYS